MFNRLSELTKDLRELFYEKLVSEKSLADLMLLRKENPFLNWEHQRLVSAMRAI